ncbi:hypothetical protein AHAS_Ahas18G0096400 [Arachis hypogaea]
MIELSSTSIREIERDVVNNEGRSATTDSARSVGPRKTKKKKRFNALQCHYGTNAILFLFSTELNPNRLFYGCPNFKVIWIIHVLIIIYMLQSLGSHCKYFTWLDDYVALFDVEGTKSFGFDSGKKNEDQHMDGAEMFGGKVREL